MKKHKWTIWEQGHFLKRTGDLLSRGYPLSEAIESLIFQLPSKRKQEISQCLSELKEGYPFYQILSNMDFNKSLIGYVFFAEQHGGLASAFQEGSEMILKRGKDLEKLKKLIAYPLFLTIVTGILFIFVENILLPRFSSLFVSMKLKPNFFTNVVYFFGDFLPFIMILTIFILLIFLGYYLLKFRKHSPIDQKRKITAIPLAGSFFRLYHTHFFAVQLSYLLSGGLSVYEALSLFERNDKQPFYREIGAVLKSSLRKGEKLEDILLYFPFFERELSSIIRHGQKNGRLDQELIFYSRYCLSMLEEKTERVLKIVQPLLYLFIGFLIISMYLAVMLPMFHLLEGF